MAEVFEVTVTAPSDEVAGRLGHDVVQRRLAACAQVGGPITSEYWWDGALERATEWTLVCKTSSSRLADLIDALRAAHPYDTPEILAVPVTGDPDYLAWVESVTQG
jgi:periplasmic divalent cation tolerance protein